MSVWIAAGAWWLVVIAWIGWHYRFALRREYVRRYRTTITVGLDFGIDPPAEVWTAERPDWWRRGSTTAVTRPRLTDALDELDESQDNMATRAATS